MITRKENDFKKLTIMLHRQIEYSRKALALVEESHEILANYERKTIQEIISLIKEFKSKDELINLSKEISQEEECIVENIKDFELEDSIDVVVMTGGSFVGYYREENEYTFVYTPSSGYNLTYFN